MKTRSHVLIITAAVLLAGSSTAASGDEQGSLSKITFYVA